MSLASAMHRPAAARRWPLGPALVLLAVAAGVVYRGAQRSPSGPDHGAALVQPDSFAAHPAAAAPRRIRLGTFNIHGGIGADGRFDLRRTADNLRGLDFAALNEVRGAWLAAHSNQAESLGRLLGQPWLFAPTERRWFHDDFGNGVVTRLNVVAWQRIPLPQRHAHSHRNLLLLAADHEGRRLHLLVTHLERHPLERPEQLRAAAELFLSLAEPAVLMGDLNTPADDPQLQRLLATPGVIDAVGQVLGKSAPPRIDWILLRGVRCLDGGLIRDGASDHPLAWAEIELPAAPQAAMSAWTPGGEPRQPGLPEGVESR